jgi:predicted O-linked N-acetylglucosamine transferase (SPINDLY family)
MDIRNKIENTKIMIARRNWVEAESIIRSALKKAPRSADAHALSGIISGECTKLNEARKAFATALYIDRNNTIALFGCGVLMNQYGAYRRALFFFDRLLKIQPLHANALQQKTKAHFMIGEDASALEAIELSIKLGNQSAEAFFDKALCLEKAHPEAAVSSYEEAIARNPNYADAYNNKGLLLWKLRRFSEALNCFRSAVGLNEKHSAAYINLAITLTEFGLLDEAFKVFEHSISLGENLSHCYSNFIFERNFYYNCDMLELKALAIRFGAFCATSRSFVFDSWKYDPQPARLRVGLVGGDFRRHPVGFFLNDVVRNISRKGIEIFIYSTSVLEDDYTNYFRANCFKFVNIARFSDDIAAKRIHDDDLHILIDVAGHTSGNRLPIFAYRPAPVQLTWLGYCGTTGLAEIDYILADYHTIPAEEEKLYPERPWRLGTTYWCFSKPDIDLSVGPLPALKNGYVTFGSFNSFKKLNKNVLDTWVRILRLKSGARLLLKAGQFAEPEIQKKLRSFFETRGIGSEKLIIEGWTNRAQYFEAYNKVDIALDPFPYPGGTTSFEGLWMGVPFVTRKGDRFYAHNGETIAHNAGLSEWIAKNEDDYVDRALAFSNRIDWLSGFRSTLRGKVLHSPLFDSEAFALKFVDAMWAIWREHSQTNQYLKSGSD